MSGFGKSSHIYVSVSVAPIIGSVIGNTLYQLILSISVSDLYT